MFSSHGLGFGKKIIFALAIVGVCAGVPSFTAHAATGCDGNGNCYVRSGASGSHTGADWTNAYTDLPASLARGVAYWVAAGTYAPHVFNDAVSGTSMITIKAPTIANHATSTGWSNGYQGQAVWQCSSSPCTIWDVSRESYITFDGSYSTPLSSYTQIATSGYGFKLKTNGYGGGGNTGNDCVSCGDVQGGEGGVVTPNSGQVYDHDLTFKYIEIQGNAQTSDTGLADAAFSFTGGSYNLYFGHLYLHDTTWDYFLRGNHQGQMGGALAGYTFGTGNNITIEYNYLLRDYTAANPNVGPHGAAASVSEGVTNLTWRYNVSNDMEGTSLGPDTASGGDFNSGNGNNGPWYLYGNVWYADNANRCAAGDGVIALYDTSFASGYGGGSGGNIYFDNNSVVNEGYPFCPSDEATYGVGMGYTTPLSGWYERNNLWYGDDLSQYNGSDIIQNGATTGGTQGGGATFNPAAVHGYDAYFASPNTAAGDSDSHKQVATNNPFTNLSGANFGLAADTAAGTTLTSVGTYWNGSANVANTFNVDMNGVTRGANGVWDRGALQIGSAVSDTTPPSVPTGLSASTVSTSQINLAWVASTDNVGVAGYKIYRNGTQVGTATTNSYSDTGLAAATTYSYTVSAYDAAGNNSAQSTAAGATTNTAGSAPVINSSFAASATVGSAFSYQITAVNNPTSYTAAGLPSPLSINTATGLISGTPTTSGTYNVTIGATNSYGTGYATLVITISATPVTLTISGVSLAPGTSTAIISWTTNQTANSQVNYGTTSSYGFQTTNATYITSHSLTISGLFPSTTYHYKVTSANTQGTISTSDATFMTKAVSSSSSGAPTFGGELYSFSTGSTNNPPGVATLATNVPVGATVVVMATQDGNDYSVTGVIDSKGNVYRKAISYTNTNYMASDQAIWYAPITKALVAGDTVTIQWSGSGQWRSYGVNIAYINGATTLDSVASNNNYMYGTTVSIPGTTSAANTIVLGTLAANDFPWSPASGWSVYRSDNVNIYYDFFQKSVAASGTVDPAGTGPVGSTYSGVWAAFRSTSGSTGSAPVINSSLTATAAVGSVFSYQITASNNPTSYTATGLPSGLSVNMTTGLISGTPTAAGTYNVTIGATNSYGAGAAILVITISPASVIFPPALGVGVTVITNANVNVRQTASISATKIATEPVGTRGTVVGGPTSANGYNWWNVSYATGANGWSIGNFLAPLVATSTAVGIDTAPISAAPSGLADVSQNVKFGQLLSLLEQLLIQFSAKAQ